MNKITEKEIKNKLLKHYIKAHGETIDRDLLRYHHTNEYGLTTSIFYSLDGTPPKGYAVYIPGHRLLNLYDCLGKRFRIIENTIIEGGF